MDAPEPLGSWLKENDAPIDAGDRLLVEQAAALFDRAGVHVPDRLEQGIDPIARLRRLQAAMPGGRTLFYRDVLSIFAEFGDRHSRCILPPLWNDRFAFLPFVVGACAENGALSLLVTGSAIARLRRGDRLLFWNGRPAAEVLHAHKACQLGANDAARLAKAVQTLTVRPLALMPPPEGEVELITEGPAGRRSTRLEWRVADQRGLERELAVCAPPEQDFEASPAGFMTRLLPTQCGPIGWMKIPSLRVPPEQFLPLFAAALDRLPAQGLVLDLRGCEEGFIQTGERLPQFFTGKSIEPLRFEVRVTEWIRCLVQTCPALADWQASVAEAAARDLAFSTGQPLTTPDALNALGRRYRGPVLLLVDALTYSTAEMFAAGVQDHGVGIVMGVANCTGGGGGSAWSQDLVHRLSGDSFFAREPGSASLRMAVFRCRRTGANAGRLLEGQGVIPDVVHTVTRRDVLCADAELIERATQLLGGTG